MDFRPSCQYRTRHTQARNAMGLCGFDANKKTLPSIVPSDSSRYQASWRVPHAIVRVSRERPWFQRSRSLSDRPAPCFRPKTHLFRRVRHDPAFAIQPEGAHCGTSESSCQGSRKMLCAVGSELTALAASSASITSDRIPIIAAEILGCKSLPFFTVANFASYSIHFAAEDHCVRKRADGHGSRYLLLRAYAVFVVSRRRPHLREVREVHAAF